MLDKPCGIIGLNPWCLNEGAATKEDKIEINEEIARKLGIHIEEFESRAN